MCVDIEIGNICNYSCSYCHPNSHSGSSWNNYNKLINFIDKVTEGKLATIILSGGEPTLYPRIDDIVHRLLETLKKPNGLKVASGEDIHFYVRS